MHCTLDAAHLKHTTHEMYEFYWHYQRVREREGESECERKRCWVYCFMAQTFTYMRSYFIGQWTHLDYALNIEFSVCVYVGEFLRAASKERKRKEIIFVSPCPLLVCIWCCIVCPHTARVSSDLLFFLLGFFFALSLSICIRCFGVGELCDRLFLASKSEHFILFFHFLQK